MNDILVLTVEQMRRIDDRIDAICITADRLWDLDPDDGGHWTVWQMLKPLVIDVVGWERDRPRVGIEAPGPELRNRTGQSTHRIEAETSVDRFLRSERAYELILDYVTRNN